MVTLEELDLEMPYPAHKNLNVDLARFYGYDTQTDKQTWRAPYHSPYDPFGPIIPVQVDNSYDKAPIHLEARKGPTPAQWQAVKDEIRILYEKKPLKDVRKILEQRVLLSRNARLTQWGFSKNYSDKDYQICAVLQHHGHKLSAKDKYKYIKGRKMSEDAFLATALKNIRLDNEQERSNGKATQSLYCGSSSKDVHHSRDTLPSHDECGRGTNEGQWPETWTEDSQDHAPQDSSVRPLVSEAARHWPSSAGHIQTSRIRESGMAAFMQ